MNFRTQEHLGRLQREGIELIQPWSIWRPSARRLGIQATWRSLKNMPWLGCAFRAIGHARFLARLVTTSLPLAAYIVRHRIHVVHCFLPRAYLVGGIATALVPGRQLAMSRVSRNFYMDEQPFCRFLETRILHRVVDAAICNAAVIRNDLVEEGVPETRIWTIRNGIDAAAFAKSAAGRAEARQRLGVHRDRLVFTTVANLYSYKGHTDLLYALSRIAGDLPAGWQLLCAGRDVDSRRATLELLARDLGLGGNVSFLGLVNDVVDLLAASDIHVHPSREEGLPNAILEAMACGLPVVATTAGGIPELVVDGVGGLLVSPGDPEALGHALSVMVRDSELRTRMGARNSRRAVETFSLDTSVREYERLYTVLTT